MSKELNSIEYQKHGKLRLSKIVEKKDYTYKGKVYDICVSNSHSYTVDDIVVHNSAGASIVVYLLGITRIDPLPWDFPFERFLNEKRSSGDNARIRLTLEDGSIHEYLPGDIIKTIDGREIKAKDLKNGDEI
jgi:intein/homing endonuclease